ncbi:nitronate monooxygenase [Prauserella shujinwangii]|uniref:Nitronate monooxygenase n=1 Tax=Prauserella shujinwangii TaxID=1453103 RepID=A0A2T0M0K4_9PSEU|nr:nitronate monooxygenase [Prauserella shujinwangii]PRX50122.1 nitronate monooxygenase [Prauserella shujinwangii]
MIRTRLTELLGIQYPVVSAPMGAVAGGRLASAVTAAGGLGLVGVSYGDPAFVEREMPLAAEGGGVWGAGCVMFTFDDRPGLWDRVLDFAPPVVALSFGDDSQVRRYVRQARDAGSHVAVQVHDLGQAVTAVDAGATMVIAQGAEAGGHHKERASLPLIPAVVDRVGDAVPVIAAGGVCDGRGLAACLALGADGVMLGTRFVATDESLASPGTVRVLLRAGAADTVVTRVFDIVRGIPWDHRYRARAVANDFTRRWTGREAELSARRAELESSWSRAVEEDDVTQRQMLAGEVVDLVSDVRPAGAVVRDIVGEAMAVLHRLSSGETATNLIHAGES